MWQAARKPRSHHIKFVKQVNLKTTNQIASIILEGMKDAHNVKIDKVFKSIQMFSKGVLHFQNAVRIIKEGDIIPQYILDLKGFQVLLKVYFAYFQLPLQNHFLLHSIKNFTIE